LVNSAPACDLSAGSVSLAPPWAAMTTCSESPDWAGALAFSRFSAWVDSVWGSENELL
jgi:hypothetical protein